MKKKILLTGASGFVGRQIARAILAAGHRPVLVLRPGAMVRTGLNADVVDVVETADLFGENADWWAPHLGDVDAVIHAAWYVEPGKYLDSPENTRCVEGSLRLAEAAAQRELHDASPGRIQPSRTASVTRSPSDVVAGSSMSSRSDTDESASGRAVARKRPP